MQSVPLTVLRQPQPPFFSRHQRISQRYLPSLRHSPSRPTRPADPSQGNSEGLIEKIPIFGEFFKDANPQEQPFSVGIPPPIPSVQAIFFAQADET